MHRAIAPAVLADMRGRLVAVEQRTTAALAVSLPLSSVLRLPCRRSYVRMQSTRPPKTLNSSATFDIDFSLPPPPAPPTIAPTRPPVGIPAETAPSPTSDNSDGAFLDGDDLDSSIAGGDPFGGAARPRDELLAGSKPPPPTQAPDVESSTQGIDSLLSQHRSTQDALTSELADMASQLRQNAHHFNTLLEKDKAVMEDAKDKLDGNLTRMQKEGGRLGKYAKRARGTTCYTILAITMVAVAWTVMFVVIRIT